VRYQFPDETSFLASRLDSPRRREKMKIDDAVYGTLQKALKAEYEKTNEKGKSSDSSKDSKSLVNETNQEAYLVSLNMLEKAGSQLQIHHLEEARKMTEKLKNMVLPNPREAENTHSNLTAQRVRDLLSE
jgi:hypothetical protein